MHNKPDRSVELFSTSCLDFLGQVLQSGLSQAPDLGCDVLPQGGLRAGEFDEGDGGLILVLVLRLYDLPRDPVLGIAAGRQTAGLSGDGVQLVIATTVKLGWSGLGWARLPQSVVNPLRLNQLGRSGAGGVV